MKLLIILVIIYLIFFTNPSLAGHPICNQEIAGASFNTSLSKIEENWKSQGLHDITCTRRMKISCDERRKQGVDYASNTRGFLENLEDKVLRASINPQTQKITALHMKMRIYAPETLKAHDEKRSWEGWSHRSLIESKIQEYCKNPVPNGINVGCNYGRGIKITVIVGSPRDMECQYIFEARFTGKRGPTKADHAIIESLNRQ